MATTRWRLPEIAPTATTAGLAAGDASLIGGFVLAGELRHYPLDVALVRTPGTLVPFLIGWAVAAVLAGLYRGATPAGGTAAVRTAVAWVGATTIAMGLRGTSAFHGDADPTFALVALVGGLILLVPWRVVAPALSGE